MTDKAKRLMAETERLSKLIYKLKVNTYVSIVSKWFRRYFDFGYYCDGYALSFEERDMIIEFLKQELQDKERELEIEVIKSE